MHTDIDFPPIEAPAPVAPPSTPLATIEQAAIAPLEATRQTLIALAEKYRNVAFDLKTPKGLAAAKEARFDLRENGRFAVQRATDTFKKQANEAKRKVEALAGELVAIVQPSEDRLDVDIKAREAEIEAERAEKARLEAARVAKHRAAIDTIRAYLTHAQQPGMTSERIARGMLSLKASVVLDESWQEFLPEATTAANETMAALAALYERVDAAEKLAAEVERQRVENERIARENAERQAELDRQAAELRRQREEIAAAQAASSAASVATKGTEDTPAADTSEAPPNADEEAARIAADALAESARRGAITAQQIAAGPIVMSEKPKPLVASHVVISDAPPITTGTICDRLGFTVTTQFLKRLGFEPVPQQRAGHFWRADEFPSICAKLAEHVLAVGERAQ